MTSIIEKENTIKNSAIEGLGLFATTNIEANIFIGVTHIRDEQFENKYIRTPLGGFYNHSNNPNVMRMVSDTLPRLKFGDTVDQSSNAEKIKDGKSNRENLFYNLQEKPDAKYMFIISIRNIEADEELVANYTLYSFK